MDEKTPYFTASAASVLYFIVYVTLKYFLQNVMDVESGLMGAVGFWIVIFIVHMFLRRKCSKQTC